MMRLSSNGVSSKRTAGGKNSVSEGPWNSSGSSASGTPPVKGSADAGRTDERYEVREFRAFS